MRTGVRAELDVATETSPPPVLLTNPLKTEKEAAASNRSVRSRSAGRDRRPFFCSAATWTGDSFSFFLNMVTPTDGRREAQNVSCDRERASATLSAVATGVALGLLKSRNAAQKGAAKKGTFLQKAGRMLEPCFPAGTRRSRAGKDRIKG